jgi:polar amino acid transport system substrate-binding protein
LARRSAAEIAWTRRVHDAYPFSKSIGLEGDMAARGIVALLLGGALLAPGAARADLLDQIKQKGEITIATEARLPPFEFVENGKIVGYDADLMAEVLKGLPGVRVNQLDLPWQGILAGLDAKKFDYVVTAVTATKERVQRYALSLPISLASVDFVKRAGDTSIMKPQDVVGRIVGAQTGSGPLQALQLYDKELSQQLGKGVAKIVDYVDYSEAYADLTNRRVDAVVQSIPNALYLLKRRPGLFEVVEPGFGPKKYYAWAGRKDADSASLAKFFDDGIARLNTSGKMTELQKKWFGYVMDVPADKLPDPEQ